MFLRDVKKGDRFIERDGDRAVLLEAIETAHEIQGSVLRWRGYECRARVIDGDVCMSDSDGIVTLFECYDLGAYRLRLQPVN